VRRYLEQKREISRRVLAEERVRELAFQDGLTGLPNRRQFDDSLKAALAAPPRSGAAHAVFLLDLNGFKQVNDVYGHGIGDELLIVAAQRLLSAVRDGDLVARFGGDEFAILARHVSGAEAATSVGLPYVATCSFDTAGRTMMGVLPQALADTFASHAAAPLAIGANCGVGASDILVTLLHMNNAPCALITKGNCGVPHFEGTEAVYSGTPKLMANYATLAMDAGARIIGGCCGTTPAHLAAMRAAIDSHVRGTPPSIETIVEQIGPLTNTVPTDNTKKPPRRSRR